ncbi:MAG: cobalamin biosynthesis protein [Nitrospirae bacterium]|nr:cobalamin biosynthesis protein [Nitrospirota bacterium]
MILLTPVGLLLPELFRAGGAWGEWGADEIKDILSYVPDGMKKLSTFWNSPISDYAFQGWQKGIKVYLSYIISGIIGVILIILGIYGLGKVLTRKNGNP